MKILVLNCGSSSLKYQLIDMDTEEVLASGKYERIGEDEAFITHKVNGQTIEIAHPAKNHEEAIDFTLKQLTNPEYKVVDSLDEIEAIGHRLAHGGMKITESVVIDEHVIEVLKECTDLAPLHNPAGIIGVEACKKVMPGKPMVGVFDTAFHQTIPEERFIIQGIQNSKKQIEDFWNTINSSKVNRNILKDEDVFIVEESGIIHMITLQWRDTLTH